MGKQTIFQNGLIYSGKGNNINNITLQRDREIIKPRPILLNSSIEFRFINPINDIVFENPVINDDIIYSIFFTISKSGNITTKQVLLRDSARKQDIIYIENNRINIVLYDSSNNPIIFRTNVLPSDSFMYYNFGINIGNNLPFIRVTIFGYNLTSTLYSTNNLSQTFQQLIDFDINGNDKTTYSSLRLKFDTYGSIENSSLVTFFSTRTIINKTVNALSEDVFNTYSLEGVSNILYDYSGNNNHLLYVGENFSNIYVSSQLTDEYANRHGYTKGDGSLKIFNRDTEQTLLYKYFTRIGLTGFFTVNQLSEEEIEILVIANASNGDVEIYYDYAKALGLSDIQAENQTFQITFTFSGNGGGFVSTSLGLLQYRDASGSLQTIVPNLTPQLLTLNIRPFPSTTTSNGEGLLLKIIQDPNEIDDFSGSYYISNIKISNYTINQSVQIKNTSYIPVLENQTFDILGNLAQYTGQAAFDGQLINGTALTFNSVTSQYIQLQDLSNVTSYQNSGTATFSIDTGTNRLNVLTSGTVYNLRLLDTNSNVIIHLPFVEKSGNIIHDIVGGQFATITSNNSWTDNTQDEYFYAEVSGFTISDGTSLYSGTTGQLQTGIIVPADTNNLGFDVYGNAIEDYGRIGYAIFDKGNITDNLKIKLNKFNAPLLNNLGINYLNDEIDYNTISQNIVDTNGVRRYVKNINQHKKDFIITSRFPQTNDLNKINEFNKD